MKIVENNVMNIEINTLLNDILASCVDAVLHMNGDVNSMDIHTMRIYEDYLDATTYPEYEVNGVEQRDIPKDTDTIDAIVLHTWWSSFTYKITKVGVNQWIKSYEGKLNGLNAQNLLADIFKLDEDIATYNTSYTTLPLNDIGIEYAYAYYMERFNNDEMFTDIYNDFNELINSGKLTFLETDISELNINKLSELTLSEQTEMYM